MTDEQVLKELISFAAFHKPQAPYPAELQKAIDGGNALVTKLFGSKVSAAKSTYDKDLQEGLKNALKIIGEVEFKWVNEKFGDANGTYMLESAFTVLQSLPDCGALPSMGQITLNIVLALESVLAAADNWKEHKESLDQDESVLQAEIDMLDSWYKGTKVGDEPQNAAPPATLSPVLVDAIGWVVAAAQDHVSHYHENGLGNLPATEEAIPLVNSWLSKVQSAGTTPIWKTFGLTQLQVERAAKIMDLVADNLGSEDERTDYRIVATALQTVMQGSTEAITLIGDPL